MAPAQTLTDKEYQRLRDAAVAIIREMGVECGGSNVQMAINPEDGDMIIIEMNPRVSRSSALASKATGFPIAKMAAKLAVGYTLDQVGGLAAAGLDAVLVCAVLPVRHSTVRGGLTGTCMACSMHTHVFKSGKCESVCACTWAVQRWEAR